MDRPLDRRRVLTALGAAAVLGAAPLRLRAAFAQETDPVSPAAAIAEAAGAFLDALSADGRSRARYAFDDPERVRWHWTTPGRVPRNGLPLAEMSAAQRDLALALLRASLSEAGYAQNLAITQLQAELGQDPTLYYATVFGEPGGADPWGWRFEGHHLSRHFTVVGDQVAAAPFFHGAWPTETADGRRAMDREEAAARELVRSLTGATRDAAVFQVESLNTHVTQNEPEVAPLDPVGVRVGDLDGDQQALVEEIVLAYLDSLPEALANPARERALGGDLDGIRFGWAGGSDPGQRHYYRLQGRTFLLEFDNSLNQATHIHSVWRDFEQDFGRHLVEGA